VEQGGANHASGLPATREEVASELLLADCVLPAGYAIQRTGVWLSVMGPHRAGARLQQGWKLHIAARPEYLKVTVDRVMPVLLEARCDFKIIANADLLREFNSGFHGTGAVGKAVTVYPNQGKVVELAHKLADAVAGMEAPQINSDRRVRPGAPVYYRFGPFSPRLAINDRGHLDIMLEAPDGRMTSGLAGDSFAPPEWVDDPFGGGARGARLPRLNGAMVIGDYYRIAGAIARNFRGTSYRAVDVRSGLRVIVKEARAFVNETSDGDARTYLRHERRVLQHLGGISGVPRVVDHFAYGDGEFLVTTDLGSANLGDDIVEFGLFSPEPNGPRNALDLARAILRILDEVHLRGVIYRDLSPKNTIPLAGGGWGLVDFELGRLAGVQRYGWTPAYSRPAQRRNEPGEVGDDYYSLGMTLFHAVTGLEPVVIDPDPKINLARSLSCLASICGREAPIFAIIRDLLDPHVSVQTDAVRKLWETTAPRNSPRPATMRRAPPLEKILQHTLDAVLRQADTILTSVTTNRDLPPPVTAYSGTAGIIMELAQHPAGLAVATELARLTAGIAESIHTAPALMYGRTGIGLALEAVANVACDARLHTAAALMMPGDGDVANEQRADVMHGLAGLGIGYLAFAAMASGTGRSLAHADLCAKRILDSEAMIREQLGALPVGNAGHGISIADGFAHGRAGIAYFLLAHAAQSGDEASGRQARTLVAALAALVPDLVSRTETSLARPMAVSWCQGLAGIGATLVRAARFFNDESLLNATKSAAAACVAFAPRVLLATQCCGLAGIGEFLLDLAVAADNIRYHRDAMEILNLMLMRSGGSRSAPSFPDNTMAASSPAWATGMSGVLSFLRRLADPSNARLWMADSVASKWCP
jgi:serine/threonine protein kinase